MWKKVRKVWLKSRERVDEIDGKYGRNGGKMWKKERKVRKKSIESKSRKSEE